MKSSFSCIGLIIAFLIFSGCKSNTVSSSENPVDFPNRFNNMERDVIYVADSLITAMGINGVVRTYPFATMQNTIRNFISTSDGKYAYFLDQSLVINSTGKIVQLDLSSGIFKFISDNEFSSFGVIGNHIIVFTDPNANCPNTPITFRAYSFMNASNGLVAHLCESYEDFLSLTGLPLVNTYSINQLRVENSELIVRIIWNNSDSSENLNTLMDVRFQFSENRLIPIEANVVAQTKYSGITSPSGKYMVTLSNNNLLLIDLWQNKEVKMIDTFTNPSVSFLANETKVAFILTRDNVTAENPSRGLFLYNINNETISEVFPQANVVNTFNFSPSATQVVLSGIIKDIHPSNNQIFLINADGTKPAMISNIQKQNLSPRFINNTFN